MHRWAAREGCAHSSAARGFCASTSTSKPPRRAASRLVEVPPWHGQQLVGRWQKRARRRAVRFALAPRSSARCRALQRAEAGERSASRSAFTGTAISAAPRGRRRRGCVGGVVVRVQSVLVACRPRSTGMSEGPPPADGFVRLSPQILEAAPSCVARSARRDAGSPAFEAGALKPRRPPPTPRRPFSLHAHRPHDHMAGEARSVMRELMSRIRARRPSGRPHYIRHGAG